MLGESTPEFYSCLAPWGAEQGHGQGMIISVSALRLLLTVIYASYLTNVGLLLMLLPWSEGWSHFILLLSPQMTSFLDNPAVRGVVSAFGFLHLALLVSELFVPGRWVRPPS